MARIQYPTRGVQSEFISLPGQVMFKHIQDMALFALLVKKGSFTRTAAELGMTKSSNSQRISCLEEELNASARGAETMQKLHLCDFARYIVKPFIESGQLQVILPD